MRGKTISDEQLLSALLQSRTIEQAATAAGCSTRTVYDRMRNADFRRLYSQSKADILRGTLTSVTATLAAAVDTTAGIMRDTSVNPAIRLQAAQLLLNTAPKYIHVLGEVEAAAAAAPGTTVYRWRDIDAD